MKKHILHIGVAKTGTTLLQNNLFTSMENIGCLGRPNHLTESYKKFHYAMVRAEDYEIEELSKDFVAEIRDCSDDTILISDETLFSYPQSLVANRLYRLFPDAKIMITIRNQLEAVKSHFTGHGRNVKNNIISHKIKHVSFDEYFDFSYKNQNVGYFQRLKYYDLCKTYSWFFGKKNIHIFPFEELVNAPELFSKRLYKLMDVNEENVINRLKNAGKVNERTSNREVKYLQLRQKLPINSIRNSFHIPKHISSFVDGFIKRGDRHVPQINKKQYEKIFEMYHLQNSLLEKEYEMDLSAFNYI